MRRSNNDLRICQIRSEVTLRFEGRDVRSREWSRIFGDWLPRPERYGGFFKSGRGNERRLGFDDPGHAIEDAVSVRREAKTANKPYKGGKSASWWMWGRSLEGRSLDVALRAS